MRLPAFLLFAITIVVGSFSCKGNKKEPQDSIDEPAKEHVVVDTPQLKLSFEEADITDDRYRNEDLQPIRDNFKRINSIKNWSKVDSADLFASTEGGQVKFFYKDGKLEKVIAREYGEIGQRLVEYYLKDGKLSFVYQKRLMYNRPVYYDSASIKENKDSVVFDIARGRIDEVRSYFINEKLAHLIYNPANLGPFSDEFLKDEEQVLLDEFRNILKKKP